MYVCVNKGCEMDGDGGNGVCGSDVQELRTGLRMTAKPLPPLPPSGYSSLMNAPASAHSPQRACRTARSPAARTRSDMRNLSRRAALSASPLLGSFGVSPLAFQRAVSAS